MSFNRLDSFSDFRVRVIVIFVALILNSYADGLFRVLKPAVFYTEGKVSDEKKIR
jgi:hypothetical protein